MGVQRETEQGSKNFSIPSLTIDKWGNLKGSPKGRHSISQRITDLSLSVLPFFRRQAYPANSFGNQACCGLLDLKALEAQSQIKRPQASSH